MTFFTQNRLTTAALLCCLTPAAHATPVWTYTALTPTTITLHPSDTATVQYLVTNQSPKPKHLTLKPTPGLSASSCNLATKGSTCVLMLTVTGSQLTKNIIGGPVLCEQTNPNQCYQPGVGNTLAITRATTTETATFSSSLSTLALSVNDTTLNNALTGNARQMTITNTGATPATGVSVSATGLPSGTTLTTVPTTCTGTLAPQASCTVTITPGASATSACNTGSAPTPGQVIVSAANATAISTPVVVLSYGCQYQGGFLYAVDDTTPVTGSIGGKVAALEDQAAPSIGSGPQATSLIWSSNGNGPTTADAAYASILGIDDTSTTATPSPTSPAYPGGTPAYTPCDGNADGACNASNIVSYYQVNRASGGSAPTPASYYAAGLCIATINTYSDWYLPAICELNAVNSSVTCPAGMQSMLGSLAFLVGDPNATTPSTSCSPLSGTDCLAGLYWSATEEASDAQLAAWAGYFNAGSSSQAVAGKFFQFGVRCSRALTE